MSGSEMHEQVQYAVMEWPTDGNQVSILHLKHIISPKKAWNSYNKGDVGRSKYPGANGEWPFIIHGVGASRKDLEPLMERVMRPQTDDVSTEETSECLPEIKTKKRKKNIEDKENSSKKAKTNVTNEKSPERSAAAAILKMRAASGNISLVNDNELNDSNTNQINPVSSLTVPVAPGGETNGPRAASNTAVIPESFTSSPLALKLPVRTVGDHGDRNFSAERPRAPSNTAVTPDSFTCSPSTVQLPVRTIGDHGDGNFSAERPRAPSNTAVTPDSFTSSPSTVQLPVRTVGDHGDGNFSPGRPRASSNTAVTPDSFTSSPSTVQLPVRTVGDHGDGNFSPGRPRASSNTAVTPDSFTSSPSTVQLPVRTVGDHGDGNFSPGRPRASSNTAVTPDSFTCSPSTVQLPANNISPYDYEYGSHQSEMMYRYPDCSSLQWTGGHVSSAFNTLYNGSNCHECCNTISFLKMKLESLERELEKVKSKCKRVSTSTPSPSNSIPEKPEVSTASLEEEIENVVCKAPCLTSAVKQVLLHSFSIQELMNSSVMGHKNVKARDKRGLDSTRRSKIEQALCKHFGKDLAVVRGKIRDRLKLIRRAYSGLEEGPKN
ncbi:uncharacterized protein LOC134240079 isoform X1 [Saccostrea cucullata]|uniref:uncharacterized protein LOC134240079 isoform X1 n=1 Tax=Saccostrea cuccullata TaxID=36930 RepID=UPI002ED319EA